MHLTCPADGEFLSCLSSAIGDVAVGEIFFLQKCHINETHAAHVETEHKHVTCEVERFVAGDINCLELLKLSDGKCSLARFLIAGVDAPEGECLFGKFLLHGPVIRSPEYAHVK